jgi:two-component system CheB/CheR fusion protein
MAKKRARGKGDAPPAKRRAKRPSARRDGPAPPPDHSAQFAADHVSVDGMPFPIAGIGASAGGLEAFSQLLELLPAEPGLALVFVQHLSPKNVSLLPDLLGAHCKLPVIQVADGMHVAPNHVYVIPPDMSMTLQNGALHLTQRPGDHGPYMPIDTFFVSLADFAQTRSIGVILSGTASDGSLGIKAIKAAGGITMAQLPETAKFEGMPRAAIATEAVDLVLTPDDIAQELVRIAGDPYVAPTPAVAADKSEPAVAEGQLAPVFELLRKATGVDFSYYKPPTIRRRIQRRMVLHKLAKFEHYLKYLEENPAEVQSLYRDILIHVTRFFREPESFNALKDLVFPKITEARKSDNPIRIWIPGCSTGEEAYSVGIVAREYLSDHDLTSPIQIFATDLSESAVERARTGIYPKNIAADVSPERLRKYFAETDGGFQINKSLRDLCVFARQDLSRDPPFSKLDLIVCRNVLIYLGPVLQKKLMTIFHYALKRHGFLMLGHAETVGSHADLFGVVDKKHRIYSRKSVDAPVPVSFPVEYSASRHQLHKKLELQPRSVPNVHSAADRLLLDRYTPPGVLVDSALQIIEFRGGTGRFLEPAPGDASLSLMKMAREGLLYGLRSALQSARKSNKPVRREGLRVKFNSHVLHVGVEILPLGPPTDDQHFLILFHEEPSGRSRRSDSKSADKPTRKANQAEKLEIARLEHELAASREYLQSVIQDMEAANEELQSANEEILSSNEELQSTNEELDTAKEELQSTNEELNTLNEELHSRNEQLARLNSDLVNLLASVQIAIVMVSADLRIRRFTPIAEKLFNLIAGDIGRPVSHIQPNIHCPDLGQLIQEVIDTISLIEREVQDRNGRKYLLRIRPYKTLENKIDGAVLVLLEMERSMSSPSDSPVNG